MAFIAQMLSFPREEIFLLHFCCKGILGSGGSSNRGEQGVVLALQHTLLPLAADFPLHV